MAKYTVHEEARPQEYVLVGEFEASYEELVERFSRGPRVRIELLYGPDAPAPEAPKKRRKRTTHHDD